MIRIHPQRGEPTGAHRSRQNNPSSAPRSRLQVQLIIRLNRDEAHVLAFDRFCNRFRVDEVVVVRLHKRLHELSGDQPRRVTAHVVVLGSREIQVPGESPLAKIGNDSRTIGKDGEELVRVVFDLGGKKEAAGAAVAVISLGFMDIE